MRTIINQNRDPLDLPDLRNLGTILRILLAVNAMVFVAAVAGETQWSAISDAWVQMSATVEPPLLVVLLALYALSPRLLAMPYAQGAASVLALSVTVVLGFNTILVATFGDVTTTTLLRRLLFALVITAALLYYFALRTKALSPAISEARLQALQARIRPHFLFNSINAVLSLIRREPKQAEEALEDLAELFRVLMRDNRQLAPLLDEVTLCKQYLGLEKLRLGERLCIEWHIDKMPEDALVPPLVLQPLLENAVYHGIEPSSAPGVIAINIFLRRGEVHAILRNPYQAGSRHKSGNRMALANIRERLALHFDAEAGLESKVNRESYEVHIRMPYRTVPQKGAHA
ncbi:MAG TPA: histidine kinase [Casimicrobiaceae bacterium]|jgi:two-component system sensor histidine kinase AlgZ